MGRMNIRERTRGHFRKGDSSGGGADPTAEGAGDSGKDGKRPEVVKERLWRKGRKGSGADAGPASAAETSEQNEEESKNSTKVSLERQIRSSLAVGY